MGNSSTISDIGIISSHAMKINLVRHIVKKRKYQCEGEDIRGQIRYHKWNNTNKLLGKDPNYNGLKTGTTRTAGACLVSFFTLGNAKSYSILEFELIRILLFVSNLLFEIRMYAFFC